MVMQFHEYTGHMFYKYTNSLTPWNRVIPEKLTVQLVNEFPTFCGILWSQEPTTCAYPKPRFQTTP